MSGVHGEVLGRLVRRGVEAATQSVYIQRLQADAELYENSDAGSVEPSELLPLFITAFITILIVASIRYTVGDVVATLAVIESPTAIAIIEDKPPAYADEPDAPLEKEPLMPSEAEADVEVLLINHKPITNKVSATVKHITRVGGFTARWRGAGVSFVYHTLHSITAWGWAECLYNFHILPRWGSITNGLVYVLASVALSRLHMAWTHAMISMPSNKWWFQRMMPHKEARAILFPSFVFAMAQQATILIPMGLFAIADMISYNHFHESHKVCAKTVLMALPFLAVPLSAIILAVNVLIPAYAALTKMEAALLPEGEETIVPFDRSLVVGDIDLNARGSSKIVFRQAWRSFGCAARLRLLKIYAKMVFMQFFTILTAAHLMVAEIYFLGGERLAVFFKSGAAQIQLMIIDAQQQVQTEAAN